MTFPTEPDVTEPPVRLPEAVRQRVLTLAAEQLGNIPLAELPATLRPFARFAPNRRAKLAAPALAAALESDDDFRQRVADSMRDEAPELAAAVQDGALPPAAEPAAVGALLYLMRPDGWESGLQAVAEQLAGTQDQEDLAARDAELVRLRAEVQQLRDQVDRLERDRRTAAEEARRESRGLKGGADRLTRDVARAEQRASDAEARVAAASQSASAAAVEAEHRERRLRARVSELEAAVESTRRAGREARSADDVRLRMLLDTLAGAAQGLRQELALPPTAGRPADAVAEALGAAHGSGAAGARGLAAEDPAYLAGLLEAPNVHLIVDGYNVSKTAYGDLTLESQRARLVKGLAALGARTRAEVTCVFDGAETRGPVGVPAPRTVRVHFTQPGRIADDDIVAFAAAEPPGRPLVVVSSDREVQDRVRQVGATAVPSPALVALLGRS